MPSAVDFAGSRLAGIYSSRKLFQARINGKFYFVKLADNELSAKKEVAAATLGIALGVNTLPTIKFQQRYFHYVALPLVKGKSLRSLTPFGITNSESYFYQSETLLKVSTTELVKALVFDYLLGNTDRHNDNVYKSDSGKLYLIDHEKSFGDTIVLPSGNVFRYTLKAKRYLDEPIEPNFQAEAIAAAESFEPYLQENGLNVVAFKQRIEKLKSASKLSALS